MSKKLLNFSIDADIAESVRPLAKKYGINLSGFVNNSLLMLLQQFEQIEKLASVNPGGVSADVARAYLDQQIAQNFGDTQSLIDEQFPSLPDKKTKLKA
jgi:hypothetical protein